MRSQKGRTHARTHARTYTHAHKPCRARATCERLHARRAMPHLAHVAGKRPPLCPLRTDTLHTTHTWVPQVGMQPALNVTRLYSDSIEAPEPLLLSRSIHHMNSKSPARNLPVHHAAC